MPKEIYIDENGNERILSSSPSALSGLLDTDITNPQANQVLAYDGSKWGNVDSGNAENVVLRQTQVALPSTVSLTANTITTLLNAVDITGLTYSALDNITTMGNDYDLVGAVFLWANGGNSMQVSMLVDTGNKVTLQVYALVNQSVTAVRLLTWWRRK